MMASKRQPQGKSVGIEKPNPSVSPGKRKREDENYQLKAVCLENQPLIDALLQLSKAKAFAAAQASVQKAKELQYQSTALKTTVQSLAKLKHAITSGSQLITPGSRPKMVGEGKGTTYMDEFLATGHISHVGKGTANYVDEFLATGHIAEIEKTKKTAKEPNIKPKIQKLISPSSSPRVSLATTVQINRAPVLTLWVTIVAERQGYSRQEALTYGKWIAGVFAQTKGRSMGIFPSQEPPTEQERAAKRRRDEALGVEHVQVFQRVMIPVLVRNDNRLAVSNGNTLNPVQVQRYLERAFGNQLAAVQEVMRTLAYSLPPEELRQRAYHLYEQFRPEWRGWGQKACLDLNVIRGLAA